MVQVEKTSSFQKVIEAVEALSPDEQAILVEIIQKRLQQQRRNELLQAVAEARQAYVEGNVRSGSVSDLLKELDSVEELDS
jgi:phage-related baseplate assembly protein